MLSRLAVSLAAALALSGCVRTFATIGPYMVDPASVRSATVPPGTPVTLVTLAEVSSVRPIPEGTGVVAVANDVLVNGQVVIRAGTAVQTTVITRHSAGWGRAGYVAIESMAAIDINGAVVPLRAEPVDRRGRRRTGAAVGLGIGLMPLMGPFAWFFFAINGYDITVPSGTMFVAVAG